MNSREVGRTCVVTAFESRAGERDAEGEKEGQRKRGFIEREGERERDSERPRHAEADALEEVGAHAEEEGGREWGWGIGEWEGSRRKFVERDTDFSGTTLMKTLGVTLVALAFGPW